MFSMLPYSVSFWVLMYFLSGKISRYAPMLTSCLSLSLSTSSVFAPFTYSAVPSTQNSPSFSTMPWGFVSCRITPRRGLVSSAGYPPLHIFSMFSAQPAPCPTRRSNPPNCSTAALCCACAFSLGKYILPASLQHSRSTGHAGGVSVLAQ